MNMNELLAMKELLNKGISVEVHEAVFNGNINICGVKIRTKVKYSGLVELEGLGDVAEEAANLLGTNMSMADIESRWAGDFISKRCEKKD